MPSPQTRQVQGNCGCHGAEGGDGRGILGAGSLRATVIYLVAGMGTLELRAEGRDVTLD